MSETRENLREAAARWFVRLQADDVDEGDWLAFRDWLEAAPEHAEAYAGVERLWVDLDEAQPAPVVVPFRARRQAPTRRWAIAGGGAAAAAAGVAALLLVPHTAAVVYQTPAKAPQSVQLADGSHLVLNRATRLAVTLKPQRRAVELAEGEASFDVAHDPARPFVIAVGDRQVRVVGTEFNILRHDGHLTVTVKRGVVAVSGDADHPAPTVTLTAGQQLEHVEGTAVTRVSQVDPQDAFGWRRGVLVYRDRPLGEVSADLARYLPLPVRVEPSAQGLRFTGLLFIDDEDAMMRRLEAFLPVTAERTSTEIRLKARGKS